MATAKRTTATVYSMEGDGFSLEILIFENGLVRAFFNNLTYPPFINEKFGTTARESILALISCDFGKLSKYFDMSDPDYFNGAKMLLKAFIDNLKEENVFPV